MTSRICTGGKVHVFVMSPCNHDIRPYNLEEAAKDGLEDEDRGRGLFSTKYGTVGDDFDDEDDLGNVEKEDEYKDIDLNLEAFEVPLREWIAQDRTRREIKKRFKKFLYSFTKGSSHIYLPRIKAMCAKNSSSLEVSYVHLGDDVPILAIWLADVPKDMIEIFDEVLEDIVKQEFPYYNKISTKLFIRVTDLPISDRLRDLRQGHLNCLVRVSGVITRRSGVFPELLQAVYNCSECGFVTAFYDAKLKSKPTVCPRGCDMPSFKINQGASVYGNYQKLTLQESPGSVPPGRVPRYKEVSLRGDLIDIARPGEEIEVTGIYQHVEMLNVKTKRASNGFPIYSTVIVANFVQRVGGNVNADISEEDKRIILQLSQDPEIQERIIRSIAPSIYGHKHIKTALALSLFGGCAKQGGSQGTHRVRGDINVLLLGDPGTAKSQILKYAEKTAPRAVYTTGKGASAVGLTAGVHKDPMTKEWTLEGGALVLADQGVCIIDEFDKMDDRDRTSIHEAMEQQTISISKAGILTSLQARCAVIAAANPILGRYDPSFTLAENVELTDPILQRFDILCVLQDQVDPVHDQMLASFVVSSHTRSHPDGEDAYHVDGPGGQSSGAEDEECTDHAIEDTELVKSTTGDTELFAEHHSNGESGKGNKYLAAPPTSLFSSSASGGPPPIEQAIFKKYIKFSRATVKPVLREVDSEKIASLYADLRTQSMVSGGVPIAVRHIESIMRMAEASARMSLRDHVRDDDVDFAIKIMLESFLQAQKVSVRANLRRAFRKYLTFGEENNQLLMHALQGLVRDAEKYHQLRYNTTADTVKVYVVDLENKAKSLNIFNMRDFYHSTLFVNHGFRYDEQDKVIIKSF